MLLILVILSRLELLKFAEFDVRALRGALGMAYAGARVSSESPVETTTTRTPQIRRI